MKRKGLTLMWNDGTLVFPKIYWFIERIKASWTNKKWITPQEFDEIRRGN